MSGLSPARRETIRFEIITAYARLKPVSGRPIRCGASKRETAQRRATGKADLSEKIIFDDEGKARACAERLSLVLGVPLMRPYPCPRSKHGHVHLTSDLKGKR